MVTPASGAAAHMYIARSSPCRSRWRSHTRTLAVAEKSAASSSTDEPTLWLVEKDGVTLHAHPEDTSPQLHSLSAGEVIEAVLLAPESEWARLDMSCASRLLKLHFRGAVVEEGCYLHVRHASSGISLFGGRVRSTSELWFARTTFDSVLSCQQPPLTPRAPVASLRKISTMDGRKVEAAPPLRHLETSVTDSTIATLIERGYAIVDHALPAALCRKLRAEMIALESNGQMWNSQSYGSDDDGAPHPHINETQLDYKEVRKYAPTFARMEHDPSLLERLRGVPGLEKLASQHVRIQINEGHGGCAPTCPSFILPLVTRGMPLLHTALGDTWHAPPPYCTG